MERTELDIRLGNAIGECVAAIDALAQGQGKTHSARNLAECIRFIEKNFDKSNLINKEKTKKLLGFFREAKLAYNRCEIETLVSIRDTMVITIMGAEKAKLLGIKA